MFSDNKNDQDREITNPKDYEEKLTRIYNEEAKKKGDADFEKMDSIAKKIQKCRDAQGIA